LIALEVRGFRLSPDRREQQTQNGRTREQKPKAQHGGLSPGRRPSSRQLKNSKKTKRLKKKSSTALLVAVPYLFFAAR